MTNLNFLVVLKLPIYICNLSKLSRRSAFSSQRWDSASRNDLSDSMSLSISLCCRDTSLKFCIVLARRSALASLCSPGRLEGLHANKIHTLSRACSNPATNSSPISNGLLNFFLSSIFHHSVKLNFRSKGLSDPVCSSRLSFGATYVSRFLMSEKLQKAILTASGT